MTAMKKVKDVMARDVVTVSPEISVRELTRILSDEGISGAPVVDGSGLTVGVVSATDVLRVAAEGTEVAGGTEELAEEWVEEDGWGEERLEEERDLYDYFMVEPAPRLFEGSGLVRVTDSVLDDYSVGDIMTPATFTVTPDTSVRDLAEFLIRGRIHRALVMDEGRLLGIVTSFDVLRVLVEED